MSPEATSERTIEGTSTTNCDDEDDEEDDIGVGAGGRTIGCGLVKMQGVCAQVQLTSSDKFFYIINGIYLMFLITIQCSFQAKSHLLYLGKEHPELFFRVLQELQADKELLCQCAWRDPLAPNFGPGGLPKGHST